MKLRVALAILAVSAGPARAQTPDSLRRLFDPNTILAPFALRMAMQDIQPVITNLQSRFGNDAWIATVLKDIKLEALATFGGDCSACATIGESGRGIQVDLALLGNSQTIATYIGAGRVLSGRSGAEHVVYRDAWKADLDLYARALASLRRRVTDIPSFEIWDHHFESQLREHLLDEYRKRVYHEIITWVILHEVGHHRLGHLDDTTRQTDELSRLKESGADVWGFRTMQRLGYRVDGVLEFLALQAELEQAASGTVTESGTHPSWRFRHRTLSQAIERQVKPWPWIVLFATLESRNVQTGGSYLTDVYLMYLREPIDLGLDIGMIYTDDKFQGMSMRRQSDRIDFFARDPRGGAIQVILRKPDAEVQEIEVRDAGSARTYAHGLAYPNPFTHLQAVEVASLKVHDVMGFSPRDAIEQSLASVTSDAAVRENARRVLRQNTDELRVLFTQFTKGSFSLAAFEDSATRFEGRSKSRLIAVLGERGYTRWASSLLGQKVIELGLSNALRMQRESQSVPVDVFARLRGERQDLEPPRRPLQPVRLRSRPDTLYSSDYKPVLDRYGLFNRKPFNRDPAPGFLNDYALADMGGEPVVRDQASGLMWQRGGSTYPLEHSRADAWTAEVNRRGYASYRDWRLPTLEEVLTLNEPEYYWNQLHIQPLFDDTQTCLWTADMMGDEYRHGLDLTMGFLGSRDNDEKCYVRLVRTY